MTLGMKGLLDRKLLKAIGIGVGVSALTTLISVCFCTTLVAREIDIANSPGVTIVIYLLSSFLGGTVAAKINHGNLYWAISITAISYFALLFLLSVILFQGLTNGIGGSLISIIVGSLCSLLLNMNEKRGKKRKRSRR